jgi:hypothetical protein
MMMVQNKSWLHHSLNEYIAKEGVKEEGRKMRKNKNDETTSHEKGLNRER